MKLTVFGATGTVGQQIVQQALASGHSVTAFCKNGNKLPDTGHSQPAVYTGDVLDGQAVEKAVYGHDAVICALGQAGRAGFVRKER